MITFVYRDTINQTPQNLSYFDNGEFPIFDFYFNHSVPFQFIIVLDQYIPLYGLVTIRVTKLKSLTLSDTILNRDSIRYFGFEVQCGIPLLE